MNKKKVWTLYRVSTKNQVTVDDIPMQRNASHEYIENRPDWILDKEFYEKGVSGWKNYSEDRDVLLEIKKGAEKKQFDILLIFMFDRLGRREDETPFIVEFFIKHGIEVWSIKEGQRKLETHVDKLMNYITFWQSSGESEKTSIRVKEEFKQMNERGEYTGGNPAFGYEVYTTDKKHPKKDKFIKDIRLNPIEAEQIKIMADLMINKGFGGRRIAFWLKENNYTLRNGSFWQPAEILRTLKNPIYKGYPRYYLNKTRNEYQLQPKREELIIIHENDWDKIQTIIGSRNKKKKNNSDINLPTHSTKFLLSGFVYCGYCNKLLGYHKSVKKNTFKDTINYKYRCSQYIKSVDIVEHGQVIYSREKFEQKFEKRLLNMISNIDVNRFNTLGDKYKENMVKDKTDLKNKYLKELKEKEKELKVLQLEVPKAIMKKSKFDEDTLSILLSDYKEQILNIQCKIDELETQISNDLLADKEVNDMIVELTDWETKYKNADFNTKKMMLSRIIDKVIFKQNEIIIDLNLVLTKLIAP